MRPILTAAEMRAAEAAVIAAGTPVEELMERAGQAAAKAIWRHAGPRPALVLCGPGNNGGDGYVIARALKLLGSDVRVAALAEPKTDAARWAASQWQGPVESLTEAAPASLLIDALFGTGLTRPLDEPASAALNRLARTAQIRAAIDLPSGVATDDGRILSPVPDFDLTVTFSTLKPSHLLQPAARHMGRLVIADIGIPATSTLIEIERPRIAAPGPDDHKYSRGFVAVVAGEMPGATALTAAAVLRAGAGYVRLLSDVHVAGIPLAVVQGGTGDIGDTRIGALAVGPGLGRGAEGRQRLDETLASGRPLVLDADALTLLGEGRSHRAPATRRYTPHHAALWRVRTNVRRSSRQQGRSGPPSRPELRCCGRVQRVRHRGRRAGRTGGYRATRSGLAGERRYRRRSRRYRRGDAAGGRDAFDAACAGVWLHGRAAELAGPGLIADDLLAALPAALAELPVTETIVRLAARGDGVTEDGRHVPLTAPGDIVEGEALAAAGPHRIVPAVPPFPGMRRLPTPARR